MRDAEPESLKKGARRREDEEWKPHTHREQEDDSPDGPLVPPGASSRRPEGAASPRQRPARRGHRRDEKQDEVDVPLVPDSRVSDQPVRVGVSAEEHDLEEE